MSAFNGYSNCCCNAHSYCDYSPCSQHHYCNQHHSNCSTWLPLIILTVIFICCLGECGLLIIMLGLIYLLCHRRLQLIF